MAIEIKSPIAVMPFGKHKGKVFWTLGVQYFNWLEQNGASPETKKTIEDAYQMFMHKGWYAVLRKSRSEKWNIALKGIYSTNGVAVAHIESNAEYIDFVYEIKIPTPDDISCAPK